MKKLLMTFALISSSSAFAWVDEDHVSYDSTTKIVSFSGAAAQTIYDSLPKGNDEIKAGDNRGPESYERTNGKITCGGNHTVTCDISIVNH